MSAFDYIQTFKVNTDIVAKAAEIMLTSVEVFFKGKPTTGTSVSGHARPGFSAWICEVDNNQPVPNRILKNSVLSIDYDQINTSSHADIPTILGFEDPVIIKSGVYYGIVIKYNDPAFDIWINKQGDRLVSTAGVTNTPSSGSQGRFDGNLYKATSAGTFQTFSDRDLKFKVNIAKFTSTTKTISLVNKDYEFFTIDTTYSGAFTGGEMVYQETANATGTITTRGPVPMAAATWAPWFSSIFGSNTVQQTILSRPAVIGVGTTFTNYRIGDYIVVANSTVKDIVQITNISNTTYMEVDRVPTMLGAGNFKVPPVGKIYYTDYTKNSVILVDSSANSTSKFVVGNRFIGVRSGASANVASIDYWNIDHFKPTFLIGNPATSQFTMNYAMANTSNQIGTATTLDLMKFNSSKYAGRILSRSVEVDTSLSSNLFGTNRKSAVANVEIQVNVNANSIFSVPYIHTGQLDFYFYQNDINANTTEARTVGLVSIDNYDTEINKNGLGKSKYLSKKISFAADKYAEDIMIYLQAYRPVGTEIKVYAKIHNSADKESFDDKSWTPLVLKNNTDKFSSDDPNDMYEYTYGVSQYPDIQYELSGSFTTGASSNTITTSSDQSAILTTGDLIRVYDPLFTDNHEVFPVASANSTAIVLFKPITNINLVSKDVQVDKLKYNNIAWNNIANDNTVRYVSSSLVEFDRYTSMQIKVVLLSDNTYVVPKVEQLQVIGVSG